MVAYLCCHTVLMGPENWPPNYADLSPVDFSLSVRSCVANMFVKRLETLITVWCAVRQLA